MYFCGLVGVVLRIAYGKCEIAYGVIRLLLARRSRGSPVHEPITRGSRWLKADAFVASRPIGLACDQRRFPRSRSEQD